MKWPWEWGNNDTKDQKISRRNSGSQGMFNNFTIDQSTKFGEGGYGATFAATDVRTGELCAVKVIDMRRMAPAAIKRECEMLEKLQHENVIALKAHGCGLAEKNQQHLYFIFMEKASGGELFDTLMDAGGPIPESRTRTLMLQMVQGIAHCHLRGIAHRDIKLENLLLGENGAVKVIDFGLAHQYPVDAAGNVDRTAALYETCGSRSYAAPEVMHANRANQRGYDGFTADVWSLGVSLFALLSGFFPLDEATQKDWRYPKLILAQNQGLSTVETIYKWYKRPTTQLTLEVINLLDGMLMIDPTRRFTLAQVIEHPWLQGKQLPPPGFFTSAGPNQGSYHASAEVDMDGEPVWRGGGMQLAGPYEDSEMMDDDAPVYRSLAADDAPPPPLPGLARQKAFGLSTFDL